MMDQESKRRRRRRGRWRLRFEGVRNRLEQDQRRGLELLGQIFHQEREECM
jgi:hypothetical protein